MDIVVKQLHQDIMIVTYQNVLQIKNLVHWYIQPLVVLKTQVEVLKKNNNLLILLINYFLLTIHIMESQQLVNHLVKL